MITISLTELTQIASLAILVLLSGFFSGSETALFSMSKLRVRHLMDEDVPKADHVYRLISEPSRLLSTLLIGNNVINIVTSSLATVLAISLFGARFGVPAAMVFTTLLVLLFGEIIPKTYARNFPEKWSFRVVGTIRFVMSALSPLITAFTSVTNLVLRLMGKSETRTSLVTEDELRTVINLGQKEGIIEAEERSMLSSVLEFTDTVVREIMVPRVDIYALEIETPLKQAAQAAIDGRHSRIPIYDKSIDHIVGIVHARDLLSGILTLPESDLAMLMHSVMFVPEALPVGRLLSMMQQKRVSMVIVLDEYGATSGIVTVEDIVEEIFGDIADEYDDAHMPIQRLDEEELLVDGSYLLDDLNEQLGVALPTELVDTIGGFVFLKLGDVPNVGDRVEYHGWEFVVEGVEGRRVSSVKVRKRP